MITSISPYQHPYYSKTHCNRCHNREHLRCVKCLHVLLSKVNCFSAILNGIDLDIENGRYTHYSTFIRELRRLEKTGKQKYIVGAAPQCPYPDR